MATVPEYTFKEKSTKLLILPPLRTISFRTFQCETPCTTLTITKIPLSQFQQQNLIVVLIFGLNMN